MPSDDLPHHGETSAIGTIGSAGRVADGLAAAWALSEAEKVTLLSLEGPHQLDLLRGLSAEATPAHVLERLAILLDIYAAIHTLLPEEGRANSWMRSPNRGAPFQGSTALEFMLKGGLQGLHEVRDYLQGEVWST